MTRPLRFITVFVGGVLLGAILFIVLGNDALGGSPSTTAPTVALATTTIAPTTTLPATTTLPPTTTTALPPKDRLLIDGTGDVAVDPEYIPALVANGWNHAWSGLEGLFLDDDLTVINLECVPSDIGTALDKAFTFRCPTAALPSLKENGVDVANMGNNHTGDFGKEALVDGRANLIAAGLGAVGAGKDFDEAGLPALYEVNGWTIAVVGFGGVAPDESWYATADRPGMRSGDHNEQMVEAVRAADEIADIVVVTIHWGVELDTTPRAEDRVRAEEMIAAGADIIFGHHPHRLQPLEFVDGKPVFWSLGNFVWPRLSDPSATTGIARVVIDPDGTIDACLIPAFIETNGRPVIVGAATCGPEI